MRILWFTATPSGYTTNNNQYNGGGWIESAERVVREDKEIELAVSFNLNGQPFKVIQNGVCYYPIADIPTSKFQYYHNLLLGNKHSERKSWDYWLEKYKCIIDDFRPDLIHIWGSESTYGLVYKITDIPIVLHIQGIMNPYMNAYLPPLVSWKEYIRQSVSLKRVKDLIAEVKLWKLSCYREREIISGIHNYLGRTTWDERTIHVMNPSSKYFHVDEILRDSFYNNFERSLPKKLTIVTTISNPLYKGFDLVLKSAKILKENLKLDFEWLCYGNINPQFIEHIVGIRHDNVNVKLMGVASQEQLVRTELNATLYFHPSYIDNSPNSLCEAQMLGLPIVSTNVGGISSLIDDGETGYLIPSNDPYQAAYLIEKLYIDKELNITLGKKGQDIARKRHNKETINNQILAVYNTLLSR